MSARDYLRSAIAGGIDGAHAESLIDTFIAEVLNEAANGLAALGLVDSLVSGPQAWTEAIETLRRMATAEQAPAPRCTCGNAAYEQMYDRRVPCKPNCEAKRAAGRVPASQPSALPVWALKCSCGGQGIVHFHADHHEPTGRVDVDPFAGRACPSCGTYVTGLCPECAPASQPETAPECRECEHPAHRPSECTEQRDGDDCACSAGQAPAPQPETAPDAPAVGDRYDCRHGGEGVTVTRLWALDNGHRAVDFEYRDGESSALPLDSFRRAYRPEAAPTVIEEFEAQHPDAMKTAREGMHAPARPRARRKNADTPGAES